MGSNNRPVGLLPQEQKWLEDVWCGRTTLNSLETAFYLTQKSGSRRLGLVEPPRTHWNLPRWPPSPFITEVWCGRTTLNSFETAL